MKKFFLSTVLIIFFSISVFAVIFCNDTPCMYENNCTNSTGGTSSVNSIYETMNIIVALGASEFIGSHSNYQLFLQQYELTGLSGFNYLNLNNFIVDAIIDMENASENFQHLVKIAEITPYNRDFIEKLKAFNYTGFQEKLKLNKQVFQKAEQFLITGDITGLYKSILFDIGGIIEILYELKDSIDKNVLPDVSTVWQLNQKYSDTLFLGQYAAMVCYKIKQ